jgi:hypothetical protein
MNVPDKLVRSLYSPRSERFASVEHWHHVIVPYVTIPNVTIPHVTIPHVTIPHVTIPNIRNNPERARAVPKGKGAKLGEGERLS